MWVECVPTCQVSPSLMAEGRLGDEREKAKVGGVLGSWPELRERRQRRIKHWLSHSSDTLKGLAVCLVEGGRHGGRQEEERERQRERCKQASQEGILTNVPNFKCVCFQGIFRNPEVELNTFYNLYRAFLGVIATLTSNQLHQPHIFTYINHILIAR